MTLVFDNCCFCIDLKTGCLILGYLSLIGGLIEVVMMLVGVAAYGIIKESDHYTPEQKLQLEQQLPFSVLIITIIAVLVLLIFTVLLLVGLHKDRRLYVKAYIIYGCICFVIYLIRVIVGLANFFTVVNLIVGLLILALDAYFLLVFRSQYIKMGETDKRPAIYNTA